MEAKLKEQPSKKSESKHRNRNKTVTQTPENPTDESLPLTVSSSLVSHETNVDEDGFLADDLTIPRWKIIQPSSRIENANPGMFRNSLTGEEVQELSEVIFLLRRNGRVLFQQNDFTGMRLCWSYDGNIPAEKDVLAKTGQNPKCNVCVVMQDGKKAPKCPYATWKDNTKENEKKTPDCKETISFISLDYLFSPFFITFHGAAIPIVKKFVSSIYLKKQQSLMQGKELHLRDFKVTLTTKLEINEKGKFYVPVFSKYSFLNFPLIISLFLLLMMIFLKEELMVNKPRPAPISHKKGYRLHFSHDGKQYRRFLPSDKAQAYVFQNNVNMRVLQFKMGLLVPPHGVSLPDFIFSNVSQPIVEEDTSLLRRITNLSQLMAEYEKMSQPPRKAVSTCRTEKFHLEHLRKFLKKFQYGDPALESINVGFFDYYKSNRYAQGIRTDTVRKELATFQVMFQMGVDHGHLKTNVLKEVKREQSQIPNHRFRTNAEIEELLRSGHYTRKEIQEIKRFRYLTEDEIKEFISLAEGKWLHPILITFAFSGIRRGELVALEWGDVDFKRSILVVRSKKQSRRRQEVAFLQASFTISDYAQERKRFFRKNGTVEELDQYLKNLEVFLSEKQISFLQELVQNESLRLYRDVLELPDRDEVRGYFVNIKKGYQQWDKQYLFEFLRQKLKQGENIAIRQVNHLSTWYPEWMRKIGGFIVEEKNGTSVSIPRPLRISIDYRIRENFFPREPLFMPSKTLFLDNNLNGQWHEVFLQELRNSYKIHPHIFKKYATNLESGKIQLYCACKNYSHDERCGVPVLKSIFNKIQNKTS